MCFFVDGWAAVRIWCALIAVLLYELAERSDGWAAPLYEKNIGRERVRGAREVRVPLILSGALIAYRPVSNSPRACGLRGDVRRGRQARMQAQLSYIIAPLFLKA